MGRTEGSGREEQGRAEDEEQAAEPAAEQAEHRGTSVEPGRCRPPGPRPPSPARRRTRWGVTAAAVLVAAVVLVLLVVRPWEPAAPAPGGIVADPARVAELEAAEAERNVENLTAAAELAVSAQERLLPVMDGLHAALPTDEARPERPTPADLGEWRDVVREVAADVEALPPGSSEHNIVRNGLLLSTGLLGDTLDVLELAGDPGGADGADEGDGAGDASGAGDAGASEDSERLYAVAGDLRSRAVDAWAQAAVQLDLQYIGADRGHLHAFLPLHSGMSTEGDLHTDH